MKLSRPFRSDPGATSAFQALNLDMQQLPVSRGARPLNAVVIGGGTGAPMSIRTLLSLGASTSAVVAMADDGGSTGILREEADVTPPGDIRKCLVAFAKNPDDPLVKVFKYRFAVARDHALGNLVLAGLEDACGSFPEAIAVCERLLETQGHVYPSTLDHVMLRARTRDGALLEGQAVACHSKTALERVSLVSRDGEVRPYQPALAAIRNADLIVLGPGSLFTSIIPNLLVPGVVEAIRDSRGSVLFVCSLADVQGETWGLTAREHFEALADHGMEGLVDFMLVHSPRPVRSQNPVEQSFRAAVYPGRFGQMVDAPAGPDDDQVRRVNFTYDDLQAIQSRGPMVLERDLADAERPTWHNPQALCRAFGDVMAMIEARRRR